MQFLRVRGLLLARSSASVLLTVPAMHLQAESAALAAITGLPQLFPVQSSLVPVVVAAAFILPAAVAGVLSVLRRATHALGPVLGLGLIVAGAAAVAVYADPTLIAALRI